MSKKTGNPRGRPKEEKLPRGRPKGQEAIMKEYRLRMLRSPKSEAVLREVFKVATDSEHKHWPAAMKLVMDRIAPAASFTESTATGVQGITVNISGVPGVNISTPEAPQEDQEALEGEFEPVEASDGA